MVPPTWPATNVVPAPVMVTEDAPPVPAKPWVYALDVWSVCDMVVMLITPMAPPVLRPEQPQ